MIVRLACIETVILRRPIAGRVIERSVIVVLVNGCALYVLVATSARRKAGAR